MDSEAATKIRSRMTKARMAPTVAVATAAMAMPSDWLFMKRAQKPKMNPVKRKIQPSGSV